MQHPAGLSGDVRGSSTGSGLSGDLRNLPVLGLDIGLGVQVSVDLAEFRARYFAVGGAPPHLVETLKSMNGRTAEHLAMRQSPGMLVDAPQTSLNWWRRSEMAPVAPDRCPTMHSARPPEAPCAT